MLSHITVKIETHFKNLSISKSLSICSIFFCSHLKCLGLPLVKYQSLERKYLKKNPVGLQVIAPTFSFTFVKGVVFICNVFCSKSDGFGSID